MPVYIRLLLIHLRLFAAGVSQASGGPDCPRPMSLALHHHGLIMSKKSISPDEQEKWRMLVNGMRADGATLRIFKKYFKPDLASSMVIL